MKEKLRTLGESMFHDMTYDIIKAGLILVFSSGFTFSGVYSLLKNIVQLPTWLIVLLAISVAALVAFFALLIYRAKSKKYTRAERIEKNDYSIVEKIVTFTYGATKSLYKAELKLLINRKTREYYGRFYWSGSGHGHIKPKNRDFTLQELKRRTRYIEYVVIFDREYKKGEELTLTLLGEMEDPQKSFSPYFATTVNSPIKKLKIVLNIDPKNYPIEALERDIVPPTLRGHENCERVQLDDMGVYTWEISNPSLTYQYSLSWSFRP